MNKLSSKIVQGNNKDESRNKWNRGQIIVKITKLRVTSFKR